MNKKQIKKLLKDWNTRIDECILACLEGAKIIDQQHVKKEESY